MYVLNVRAKFHSAKRNRAVYVPRAFEVREERRLFHGLGIFFTAIEPPVGLLLQLRGRYWYWRILRVGSCEFEDETSS